VHQCVFVVLTLVLAFLLTSCVSGGSGSTPTPQGQTVNFGSIAVQTVGTPLTLSASATSGLTVSFASTTPSVCTVSGTTASFIASGTCTIQATQAGNSTYSAAAPVSQSFTVSGESQTIAFGSIATQAVAAPLTLSASATSGLTVSFASTTPDICTVSGSTANFISGGSCTIQAAQSGNSTYAAAAPVSQSFTVNNPAPAIYNISPNFAIAGSSAQNITLTGANFLPASTATYAGAVHAVIYVNPSTVLLPLSNSDLISTGIKAVVLANSSPGGGSASFNLPVLYETDTMLSRSQLAAGNQARLQSLIQKGRNGTPVTIAAIGGSITECDGSSNFAHCYLSLVQDWWNNTFPASASTVVDAGIPATSSDYGSLRLQRDVLSKNPDLVIVEFGVNDRGAGLAAKYGETYDGLVRQLLDAPSHPAVILLFMSTYELPVDEDDMTAQSWQSLIGANYDLPMVSYFDAISPELTDGNIGLTDLSGDGIHPNDSGYAYVGQFLDLNLQNAVDNFPDGTTPATISATQAPLHSSDFEFTTMEDGIGTNGPGLNPTGNQGWISEPAGSDQFVTNAAAGLESSTPGSTLDFTVTGKDIVLGYWTSKGPMGQVAVTVDGAAVPVVVDGWNVWGAVDRAFTQVASGLTAGSHQVHIELLDTDDVSGYTFRLLIVGTGGAQ